VVAVDDRAEGDHAGWTNRCTAAVDVVFVVVQVHVDDHRRRRSRLRRRLPDHVQTHRADVVERRRVVILNYLAALLGCTTINIIRLRHSRPPGGPAVADTSGPARCASAIAVSQSVGRSVRPCVLFRTSCTPTAPLVDVSLSICLVCRAFSDSLCLPHYILHIYII